MSTPSNIDTEAMRSQLARRHADRLLMHLEKAYGLLVELQLGRRGPADQAEIMQGIQRCIGDAGGSTLHDTSGRAKDPGAATGKGRSHSTREAAEFLGALGVRASIRTLARQRARYPEDPGDHGPAFYRDPGGACLYFERDLQAYATARLEGLAYRGKADAPPGLRRRHAA